MKTDKQFDMNTSEPNVDFLANTGRKTGMTLPDGFFTDFSQRMEAAIDAEEKQRLSIPAAQQQPASIGSRRKLWIGVAACALIALCAMPFLRNVEQEITDTPSLAAIEESYDESEQDEFLYTSLSDYDMYDYYCEAM